MSESITANDPLLRHAAALFQQHGYDNVSLSDIAAAAGVTLAAVEEAYPRKLALPLAIYRDVTRQLVNLVPGLPAGSIAQRYVPLMQTRLAQYAQHEDAIAALFANMMRRSNAFPSTELSVGRHDPLYEAFQQTIRAANDAPTGAQDVEHLTMLLYTFHFLVTVFWLYDPTHQRQATALLLDFLQDVLKVIRPMMIMPLFGKAMNKLAQIMMLVFGGAHFTDQPGR